MPGVHAGNIIIGVDDSVSVWKKLGAPDFITPLNQVGTLWMYAKLGIGVQFKGDITLYSSVTNPDTTV